MPNTLTTGLHARPEPMTQHLNQAEVQLEAARVECYRIHLLEVARIVRAVLPAAASISIMRGACTLDDILELVAVHANDGTRLWSDEDPHPWDDLRFSDDADWKEAVADIGNLIRGALCGEHPAVASTLHPEWSGQEQRRECQIDRVALPDAASVDLHIQTLPTPRREAVIFRDPDGDIEFDYFTRGTAATVEVTVIDPGRGSPTASEWRALAACYASTASPAAAERIREYFHHSQPHD